ncbi:MAG: dihydroxy-acid dehydratase, partial [Isosphaeraceae bacterium]
WARINRRVPRLVSVLPNGPWYHPTVRAYLAGGVPEVMLHLRNLGLLHLDAITVTGQNLGQLMADWEKSDRRRILREQLIKNDGVDPDQVILNAEAAKEAGLTSTVCFPNGNLAPEGSVIKSTAIDATIVDADGVYRKTGPARVFTRERDAIAAIKGISDHPIKPGDIIVLIGRGPIGAGMEEIYQITSALKHLSWGKEVAVITDARFSGVSTGACIGHVGPEALAGGPVAKVRDGDIIQIEIDRNALSGRMNLIGSPASAERSISIGDELIASRPAHTELSADPEIHDDTRLWAALQAASGGTWGGCVFDVDTIIRKLGGN